MNDFRHKIYRVSFGMFIREELMIVGSKGVNITCNKYAKYYNKSENQLPINFENDKIYIEIKIRTGILK